MAVQAKRNNDLARIHIAKKDLNLSDDEYRDLMKTICGVSSSAELDMGGRARFLDHLNRIKRSLPAKKRVHAKLTPKQGKVFSLWQQLADAGLVRDRKFPALEAWLKAKIGVDKLIWLNNDQLAQAIESLKRWLDRRETSRGA
jgi:phage gp16-like protein